MVQFEKAIFLNTRADNNPATAQLVPPNQVKEASRITANRIGTIPPISKPAQANVTREETRYRLNTHHNGNPKTSSAAYANASMYSELNSEKRKRTNIFYRRYDVKNQRGHNEK